MPHDKNGAELKVGDKVTVEFTAEEVNAHPDHCNLKAKTVEPFHPNPDGTTTWFNTKQVVKVGAVLLALLLLAGDALAFGRRCSAPPAGCSTCSASQPRGGLLAGIRDRIQARHDARAGGCQQPPAVAFPPASPAAYTAGSYGGGGCPGGVCPGR